MIQKKFTKAEVLEILLAKAKSFHVEPLYFFSVEDWRIDSRVIIDKISQSFKSSKIVVRSSAVNEDTAICSMAGYYTSELDVDLSDRLHIKNAVESVISSYKKRDDVNLRNQILVQSQTEGVKISGVVLTRDMSSNAPYYIVNYDDRTGRTDTVTSGINNKMTAISRFVKEPYTKKWRNLLIAIREIETIFSDLPLDIEFAVNKNDQIVIFQVRPLIVNKDADICDDDFAKMIIRDMKDKFLRFNRKIPHLGGKITIFGDMPDWNPAEIIGDRPNTLDYTLYRFLITNNIWHEARTSLGYSDVFPGELMTSFAKKPYIDVRLSFNSMIPAGIPFPIREKLINYYLWKLNKYPELQDKVEFEILWTCYDFSLEKDIRILLNHGFSENEINIVVMELKKLTIKTIKNSEDIFKADIEASKILAERKDKTLAELDRSDVSVWELLSGAHYILYNCKKYGTFPFSRLARIAFIANSILLSLEKNSIIDDVCYDSIMLSVQTVAKHFSCDFEDVKRSKLSKKDFLKKYGHLRAGTYDVTSPRYDQQTDLFEFDNIVQIQEKKSDSQLAINYRDEAGINRVLQQMELDIDAKTLINFIVRAFEYRELSKFEFTKSLSDSIELLNRVGGKLDITSDQLCHCDFETLMKFRNIEISDIQYVKQRILNSISRHKKEKERFAKIILPPVIRFEEDFDYAEFCHSRPNYITQKKACGEIIFVSKSAKSGLTDINNKIVLIESADPGFDWIFTRSPLALVTKFGGVASHMAIRCAEFGIPAVIGCGEVLFNTVQQHKKLSVDCKSNKLRWS